MEYADYGNQYKSEVLSPQTECLQKAGAPFFVKNVSTGCNLPIHSGKENQTAPGKYVIFKYSRQEK